MYLLGLKTPWSVVFCILTRYEYTNEPNVDLTTVVKPGDTMEVKVLKVNDGEGQVILTYKKTGS